MSHTFFVKFQVFKGAFPRNHSVCRAQIFRDNWNCCGLSTFRGFVFLASLDNDEHINKAKNASKDSPMETESPSWMGQPVEIKFNFALTCIQQQQQQNPIKTNVLYCRNNK